MSEKVCTRCRELKALCAFQKNSSAQDGLSDVCRGCLGIAKRESDRKARELKKSRAEVQRAAREELMRETGLSRNQAANYKLTPDQYRILAAEANGRCRICGSQTDLVIDHCHKNGHVRGLLCPSCNSGLGFFNDDVERLRAAIEYLSRTSPAMAD